MRSLLFTCAVVASTGCGPGGDAPEVFIALPKDFNGFDRWEKFELPQSMVQSVHTVGPRTEYLNKRPPKGSSAFPVGTIIVKTVHDAAQTFAMVKRGGGYNANGATEWEWFELNPNADGQVAVVWQGIAPPSGEQYAGIQGGSCNGCHVGSKANDFVQGPPLQLDQL